MDNSLFIIAITVISCFFLAYTWFAVLNNLSSEHSLLTNMFLPIITVSFLGSSCLYFLLPDTYDQIFKLSYLNIIIAYAGSLLIYLGISWPRTQRINYLFVLGAALLGSLFIPSDFLLFEGYLPFWADRILLLLIWATFSWCYKHLNGIDGIIAVQTITPLTGLIILSFIEALPLLLGANAAVFLSIIGALSIYIWYPAERRLTDAGCQALGFLMGGLLIQAAQEGCASCVLIFSLYYITETAWAFFAKLSRKTQYQNITGNTFYYQTNISGLSPALICGNIFKLNTLLVIFGSFQAYAPNNYSVLILAVLLTLWYLNRLINWQTPVQSFSELNKETLNDLKENIDDFKKSMNKDR